MTAAPAKTKPPSSTKPPNSNPPTTLPALHPDQLTAQPLTPQPPGTKGRSVTHHPRRRLLLPQREETAPTAFSHRDDHTGAQPS